VCVCPILEIQLDINIKNRAMLTEHWDVHMYNKQTESHIHSVKDVHSNDEKMDTLSVIGVGISLAAYSV